MALNALHNELLLFKHGTTASLLVARMDPQQENLQMAPDVRYHVTALPGYWTLSGPKAFYTPLGATLPVANPPDYSADAFHVALRPPNKRTLKGNQWFITNNPHGREILAQVFGGTCPYCHGETFLTERPKGAGNYFHDLFHKLHYHLPCPVCMGLEFATADRKRTDRLWRLNHLLYYNMQYKTIISLTEQQLMETGDEALALATARHEACIERTKEMGLGMGVMEGKLDVWRRTYMILTGEGCEHGSEDGEEFEHEESCENQDDSDGTIVPDHGEHQEETEDQEGSGNQESNDVQVATDPEDTGVQVATEHEEDSEHQGRDDVQVTTEHEYTGVQTTTEQQEDNQHQDNSEHHERDDAHATAEHEGPDVQATTEHEDTEIQAVCERQEDSEHQESNVQATTEDEETEVQVGFEHQEPDDVQATTEHEVSDVQDNCEYQEESEHQDGSEHQDSHDVQSTTEHEGSEAEANSEHQDGEGIEGLEGIEDLHSIEVLDGIELPERIEVLDGIELPERIEVTEGIEVEVSMESTGARVIFGAQASSEHQDSGDQDGESQVSSELEVSSEPYALNSPRAGSEPPDGSEDWVAGPIWERIVRQTSNEF